MPNTRELIYKDEALGAILQTNSMFAYCINNIKPVDAVEVVRCKDCKYRGDYPCPMYYDEYTQWDDDGYIESEWIDHDKTVDNGFCHMGEKRDDDEID